MSASRSIDSLISATEIISSLSFKGSVWVLIYSFCAFGLWVKGRVFGNADNMSSNERPAVAGVQCNAGAGITIVTPV